MENEGANREVPQQLRVMEFLQVIVGVVEKQQVEGTREDKSAIADFKRLDPLAFQGSTDPLAAETWIQEMEKAFALLSCALSDKVKHATFILRIGAYDWWLMEKRKHEQDSEPYT